MKVERADSPFATNPGAPVIPASIADQIKPSPDLPPAGHSRDELLRARRDRLEEQIGLMPQDRGGVDVSTLPLENEVVEKFDHRGNLPVSGWDRNKWMVKWKLAKELAMQIAADEGWETVSDVNGRDPIGREYIGKGPAAGTTLRGHVDVLLVKMPRERYERMEEERRIRQRELGQVTERFEDYGAELAAQGLTPKNLAHGRRDDPLVQRLLRERGGDPLIQRVFANGPTQAREMTRVLREGSLPGARADQIFGGRR